MATRLLQVESRLSQLSLAKKEGEAAVSVFTSTAWKTQEDPPLPKSLEVACQGHRESPTIRFHGHNNQTCHEAPPPWRHHFHPACCEPVCLLPFETEERNRNRTVNVSVLGSPLMPMLQGMVESPSSITELKTGSSRMLASFTSTM